jgi:molecular chaperone GrpE
MPDTASPLQLASPAGQSPVGPLTPERIERALADFRDWLSDWPAAEPPASPAADPVDLHALVGQFTALRHEVNLQTKAARSSLEQNAETLRQLEETVAALQEPAAEEKPDAGEQLKPLFKAIIDVYDALALASRHIEKQKAAIHAALAALVEAATIDPPPVGAAADDKPGFWKRFLGSESPAPPVNEALTAWYRQTIPKLKEREQKAREASDYLKDTLDALLTGYAMSLNRVDRVLKQFGLEPMHCAGERFDPELMEVVEAVSNSGRPLSEVLEEVRRGYLWNGSIFRYAQVRVAR